MPKDSMTPKERWLAVMNSEKPDRIPMDYWGTDEATAKVMRHLGCATRWEMVKKLHIDIMVGVGPKYVGPPIPANHDMYGCRHEDINYGGGTYPETVSHPLAQYDTVEEIEANYTWPSVDWFDFSGIPARIEGKEDHPIRGGGSEPFLIYKRLRGMEQAYMDLVVNPEIVHYCLDKLFDHAYEYTTRIYEQLPGKINFSYVAEDFGGQENLLFSAKAIRTFFLPRMKRMIDLAHQNGIYAFFHSDGAIRSILPDMIAAGIDVLNPIQWRCSGMERAALKRDFGQQVVFHGGVDNQQTMPFGDVADVEQEIKDNIDILGANGGYILAPCHNIQVVSPAENVIALYETGYHYGRF